jgi:hypothetical protein
VLTGPVLRFRPEPATHQRAMRARRGVRANGVSRAGPALAGRLGNKRSVFPWSELTDFDIIAREVSGYRTRFEAIEKRLDEVERVNARLEDAALTTARALGEISGHWNAVYEAMRRRDESQMADSSQFAGGHRCPPQMAVADRALETSVCCALAGHVLMPLGRRPGLSLAG